MASILRKIKGNTYYIDGSVNIGVIRNGENEKKSIAIDTGIDDESGRKILKLMREEGMEPGIIINTHSHADHCGGNSFVKSRAGSAIYAPDFDKAIIEYPELEPFYLYSACPLKEMDTKFLKAKPSYVDFVIKPGKIEIEGIGLEIMPLYGHTPGMIGVLSGDNVLFTADAFFSLEIVNKYGLPYFTDIKSTIKTLEFLKETNYDYYVPCHGSLLEDIIPTVNANLQAINNITEYIAQICNTPLDREEIMAKAAEKFEVKLSIPQYYLTLSTISAFLSYMSNEGILNTEFIGNKLKFYKKTGC